VLHTLLGLSAAFAQQQPASGESAAAASTTPSPPAEALFSLGPIPITNTILTTWVVILLIVVIAFLATRRMRLLPTGVQNAVELLVEVWVGLTEQNMGPRRGRRFLPLIATAFIFIVVANWFGTLPIVGPIYVNEHGENIPLLRSSNSDLNLTAAMAVLMILLAEVFELRALGLLRYLRGLLIPNPMRWLEIVTRPLSLSFRLFGNIFAGEVLIATMLSVAPFALFIFLGLELFVGLIQALIFAMLSLVFLTIATAHEEEHELETHPGEQLEPSRAAAMATTMEHEPH
jgi:F-type H+-transporting ATPase subunit a